MVTLEGYIVIPEADLEAVLQELPLHIALSLKEEGCITFNVTIDENNKNRLNVYEEFQDQEAFTYHQVRVKSSRWGVLTKGATRHYSIYQ